MSELINSDHAEIKNIDEMIDSGRVQSSFHTYFINDVDVSSHGINDKDEMTNNVFYTNEKSNDALSDDKNISSSIANYSVVNYDNDEMLATAGHDTDYHPEDEKQTNIYGDEQLNSHSKVFDTTIAATIAIENITADDIINAAEAKTDIPVHGTVGADVQVGDTVTVTVGSQTYTTTVQAGNTWTVNVPGKVLVDNGGHEVQATVSTTDDAGNTVTADAEHPYTVDTSIAATIAIENITADDIINAAEAKTDIPVHGTVGDDVKVGDTVTVTVGTETYTTTVQAGNTWTVNVPGKVLVDNGGHEVQATVSTTDDAGNTVTANAEHPYTVDTSIAATIAIENITADDIINAAEAKTDIPVHGTVGDDVKVGDTVTVTVGSETYTTTVQTGNTWTVNVPGKVLVDNGGHDVQATVTTTDTAGNTATANAEHPYTVDTTIAATITIENITADDVINAAEAKTDIPVHGTVGDDVKVGDTVTVTVGSQTYTTTVQTGNTWTVDVPGKVLVDNGGHEVQATVTTTDVAGNTATANADHPYAVAGAINATIAIENITADDIINAAEAKTDIPVHGTVGADVQVGDTVTVTVGSQTYTTTVQTGNTWTVNVPGKVLVDNGSHDVQATVTTTDVAGNTATANADHPYTVDTTIAATIAIENITADDIINAAEAKTDIPVHGTVGDDVKVGDTVTVTVGSETYTTTVQTGNTWTVDVPGKVLVDNGGHDVQATVTTTDVAGNTATANADHPYTVDTTIAATIAIENITADDIINAAEAKTDIPVHGTVGNDVKVGDTVTVTVGSETYTTTVQAGNTWTVNVPGKVLVDNGGHDVQATVTTTDVAGNTATANADHPYTVDTAIAATIAIDNITADDVINAAEAKTDIPVHGTVGNDVKVGDIVTVTVGSQTYTTTVQAGNTWTVNVPGKVLVDNGGHDVQATVTTTDTAGNTATANAEHPYTVDTSIAATIAIENITADDIINAAEAKTDIPVHGTVGDDVKVGDTVTVTVGTETYTTTVQAGNTWTVDVPGSVLVNNSGHDVQATVTTTDTAGNTATANAEHPYTVDTSIAATIAIENITADDIINATEAKTDIPVHGTVGDDVKVGDTVTVTVGTETYTTTVQAGNTWTVNVPGKVLVDNGSHDVQATVTTTDVAGNTATANADHPYAVAGAINATIAIENITADDIINAAEAKTDIPVHGTVGADVQVGDTVTVTVGSETYTTTVQAGNTWTVDVPGSVLVNNSGHDVQATVTTTDVAGNTATADADHPYTVDTAIAATIAIDNITSDDVINAAEAKTDIPVHGTVGADVQVGDTVTVTVGSQTYTTTVQTGNTWTVDVPGKVLVDNGGHEVQATVTTTDDAGNTVTADAEHPYTVDTTIAATITIDNITADDVINAAEAKTDIPVHGTVGADVQVGDIVTVKVGDNIFHTIVKEGNVWSVSISGSILVNADLDTVFASVTAHDNAGNIVVADTSHDYNVSHINAVITIDPITGDNIIDAKESSQTEPFLITGSVSGDAKVGDIVEIKVGDQTISTHVISTADGLGYSTSIDVTTLDDLINQSNNQHLDISATVHVSNQYGDTASAEISEVVTGSGLVEEYGSESNTITGSAFNDVLFADDSLPVAVNQNVAIVLDSSGSMRDYIISRTDLGLSSDIKEIQITVNGYNDHLPPIIYNVTASELEAGYHFSYNDFLFAKNITYSVDGGDVKPLDFTNMPDRAFYAKEAIETLVNEMITDQILHPERHLGDDGINLIAFATEIKINANFLWDDKEKTFLNSEHQTVKDVLDKIDFSGENNFEQPLIDALSGFKEGSKNAMFFISDADRYDPLNLNKIIAEVGEQHLKNTHPQIVTVGVSTDYTGDILQNIASLGEDYKANNTGDSHFIKVVNLSDLNDIFLAEADKITAGNDTVNSGDGNDIIISDIIDYDWLDTQIDHPVDNHNNIIGLIIDAASQKLGHEITKTSTEFYDYVKDNIDQLTGGDQDFYGNDIINAGTGDDLIYSGGGDDIVNGQEGNDIINSGIGNDIIYTGQGNDTINTGLGDDIIIISKAGQDESFSTTIEDFSKDDRIDLSEFLNNCLLYTSPSPPD
ncbi:Ig-like domain-containing protein, partial [Photobacterium phosphoreum]|uniref:Ig-like domain-containing protein n=1 Tax=Photobacterium phosphoreum TaxID=659 RepID=UPI0015E76154